MKLNHNFLTKAIGGLAIICASATPAAMPTAWQHTQSFEIAAPGLVKISLPAAALDAARPALEDLRLYDAAGNELPYLIEHPAPAGKAVQPARSFQVSLQPSTTVITLETGITQPIDGVTLETPAQSFIKAVRIEGSTDGKNWRPLVQGQPIFRQPYGAGQLRVSFPAGAWRWLRLTVDDQRSAPIPFTGARIFAAAAEAAPGEWQPATIAERNENPGETRLTLNLGAANLEVATVKIEIDEPLFTRTVKLAMPQVSELGVFEQVIGQGTIYRIAIEGQPAVANFDLSLERQIRSRELVLLIRNGDSPPLPVRAVSVERRPVYLTFMARTAGKFYLLAGNKNCAAPRYDLAALGANLKSVGVTPVEISALTANPDYRAPEALAGLEVTGASLDVSAWKYRKPIRLAAGGAQQIELDLDVLAHAEGSFADLRILQGSNQVPYLVQRTSISRTLTPTVTLTNDAKNPHFSRWIIKLPQAHLPITHLTCAAKTSLFQRSMTLSGEFTDERGDTFYPMLGNATWTQTPESGIKEFSLPINIVPQGDTLLLETDNGDNSPIKLDNFKLFYPATRILFKAGENGPLYLYYGHPQAAPPNYDLSLLGSELLTADKATAALGTEDQLRKTSWAEGQVPGHGGIIFWGIMAVVVIGLLAVISRLLPKPPASAS